MAFAPFRGHFLRTSGAAHYRRDFDPALPPDNPAISDEEIGIGLCLGEQPYKLDNLRAAAQLLSSPRVDAARLCRLAVQERCEPVLLHIATVAHRFVPDLQPWAYLANTCHPGQSRAPTSCLTGPAPSAIRV